MWVIAVCNVCTGQETLKRLYQVDEAVTDATCVLTVQYTNKGYNTVMYMEDTNMNLITLRIQ